MKWHNPVPYKLVPTQESESFKTMKDNETGLPLSPHPGSFGFVRKNHTHEGVDLYVPEGTPVFAVENGIIVNIIKFTGEHCGSDWWENTWSVMIEGKSGVVNYGEIIPSEFNVGDFITRGDIVGAVKKVLKKDKGRPMSMLHLELYKHGTKNCVEWKNEKDENLLDPTPYLLNLK